MYSLLMFHTDHCSPCKAIKPQVEQLELELQIPVRYINALSPEAQADVETYGVRTVPTVVLLRDGKPLLKANAATFRASEFRDALLNGE